MSAKASTKRGAAKKPARPVLTYPFQIKRGVMHCEGVNVADLARQAGTPLFVYSAGRIRAAFNYLKESFREADPLLAYSLKALRVHTSRAATTSSGAASRVMSLQSISSRPVRRRSRRLPHRPPMASSVNSVTAGPSPSAPRRTGSRSRPSR